jgi:multidrug efflux system membrane fusion protein
MNVKFVTSGVIVLGLVIAGYAYREQISDSVAGLFGEKKPEQAQSAGNSGGGGQRGGRRGRRGGGGVSVTLATVESRNMPLQLTAIGTVEAVATVAIKARVDGQLIEAFFEEGQRVQKGQKLFRIDPRPFETTLRQAQANLARDRAQAQKAKGDLERYKSLAGKGFASRQKFEEASAANAAMASVVIAGQAAVDQAKLQLGFTTITSPIDGRTGSLLVSVGNLVKANDTQPLVSITQIRPINVVFSVPERHRLTLRRLMASKQVAVEAVPDDDTAQSQQGVLTFVNNTVDAGTGTIQLKARFPNENEVLSPGAFVNIALTLKERPEAITIPTPALQVGQNGAFVFVANKNNKVELRRITVADSSTKFTVVASGLKAGEKVVTDGQLQLVPGASIRPRKAEADNASAAEPGASTANGGGKKKRKKRSRDGGGK